MSFAKDFLEKIKGQGNANKTLTGKGSFSRQGFKDLVGALANDNDFKVTSRAKNGEPVETSISSLIKGDILSTMKKLNYPNKQELAEAVQNGKIDVTGLSEAIPHIVMEQIKTGKKFDLPANDVTNGSIYLAPVAGKTKTVTVRDIKTKEELGTATITTQDSIQVRSKSPVPKHLQTKVRKDKNGNVVK